MLSKVTRIACSTRPEAARDVVQDAFVRLHLKWASVRNPAAYVQRSVVNGCRSHHRQSARDASRAQAAAQVELEGEGAVQPRVYTKN